MRSLVLLACFFFFQAEDGIRDGHVTGVQTCALPICANATISWPDHSAHVCCAGSKVEDGCSSSASSVAVGFHVAPSSLAMRACSRDHAGAISEVNVVRRSPEGALARRVAVGVFDVVTANYILTRPLGCARKYSSQGSAEVRLPGDLADRDDPQRTRPHQVAQWLVCAEPDPPAGLVEPRGGKLFLHRNGMGGDEADAGGAVHSGGRW